MSITTRMILRPTTRLHLHKWEAATTTISRVKSPRFLKRYFQQSTAAAGCGFHWHIFNSLEVEHYKNQKCTAILYVLDANGSDKQKVRNTLWCWSKAHQNES